MTTTQPSSPSEIVLTGRALRHAYDQLSLGDRAALRRCGTAQEVLLEGAFWNAVRSTSPPVRSPERAAAVFALFPACEAHTAEDFRLGSFFNVALNKEGRSTQTRLPLAFRQLLACRTSDELVHRLRRVLTAAKRSVDWGVVYADVVRWSAGEEGRESITRRWVRDYFADTDTTATD